MKIYSSILRPGIICLTIFSSFSTASYTHPQLEEQARSWLYRYVLTEEGSTRISHYDIQAIANLLYLSWCRSVITLEAQYKALQTVDIIWKGWQNIAQTRLDPSIDIPYAILPEQQEAIIKDFWTLAQQHRSIGITYSYAVKMILEKQILQTTFALDGVATMRNGARAVVLDSFLDVRNQLGEFFHLSNKTQSLLADLQPTDIMIDLDLDLEEHKKGINLLDYISIYIPQLALHSFVEANNTHNLVSEEGWQVLKMIQEIGNQTWKTIEEARADFYRAYYMALFNAIKQYNLPDSCLLLMFNEQGIIIVHDQHQYLPESTKLELPSYES
ncbi:hypothetical protein E3J79_03075 [Candidatus Dependentiae bacterium]|nr:MAG: hypothetical protein E3J79_03075 [Candidatus Dependentiae bacterium]